MRKWIAVLLVVLLALAGYVVAGPYLTVQAIRKAVAEQDAAALSRQVDFPALRASLKRQVADRLVREAGPSLQSSLLGALGISVASGVAGGMVDAMVTPIGLGALMEGRKVWDLVGEGLSPASMDSGASAGTAGDGNATGDGDSAAEAVLQDPRYRFESTSRFTATVSDDAGRPVVFVMTRSGLRWRLSDIQLPMP